jgi:arginase
MKIYFPQWQGAGIGQGIEAGAKTVLDYLNNPTFKAIPLSSITAGKEGVQKHNINNYDAIFEQLSLYKKELEKHLPLTIQTIGGDCGLEIVPVSYLNKIYPNLGVIWFDAHADINRPCDSASCNFHGMPLRTLLGEGEDSLNPLLFSHMNASQIHYVGLRDIDATEKLRLDKDGIYHPRILDIEDLMSTLSRKRITHLYLHFDFDCLDPKDYDKTYYNVPNGTTIKEAVACIKCLQQEFTIAGSSVLESTTLEQEELAPITPIIDLLMK